MPKKASITVCTLPTNIAMNDDEDSKNHHLNKCEEDEREKINSSVIPTAEDALGWQTTSNYESILLCLHKHN